MKKLLVIRKGLSASQQQLRQLLGSRLVSPSEAAAAMLDKLRRTGFDEAANTDDYFVCVCVASEDSVVRALRALGRHSGTVIHEITVHE